MSKKQPLTVEVRDGVLTISVGIEILKSAAETAPDERLCWYDSKSDKYLSYPITDPDAFANDVCSAIEAEVCVGGDGTSYLHKFFDDACVRAIEEGSLGVAEDPAPVVRWGNNGG